MSTRLKHVLASLGAVGALALAGCGGAGTTPTGVNAQSIRAADLPDVPGCDAVKNLPAGTLLARAVQGVVDLYLVTDNGAAICIDSGEEIFRRFGGIEAAASNPMPGQDERAASNPMPGNPGDPAASNPMPGTGPADSNPMPGTGPADSNPMPGHDPFVEILAHATH